MRWAVLLVCLVFATAASAQSVKRFSDEELIDGFVRTVFGAEYEAPAAALLVVKKFTRPIRIRVEAIPSATFPQAEANRRARLAETIIRRLAQRVPTANIAIVNRLAQANVLVAITDRRHYLSVGDVLLRGNASFMRNTTCAGVPSWFANYALERSITIIPGDLDDTQFASCVSEETLQVLGPVNDDGNLPYSTFNDSNDLGGFPLFDQMILNMLYDRRVRPGMTEQQVRAILPAVLRDVRPRVEGAALRRAQGRATVGGSLSGLVWD
jgi:hypothetical protein